MGGSSSSAPRRGHDGSRVVLARARRRVVPALGTAPTLAGRGEGDSGRMRCLTPCGRAAGRRAHQWPYDAGTIAAAPGVRRRGWRCGGARRGCSRYRRSRLRAPGGSGVVTAQRHLTYRALAVAEPFGGAPSPRLEWDRDRSRPGRRAGYRTRSWGGVRPRRRVRVETRDGSARAATTRCCWHSVLDPEPALPGCTDLRRVARRPGGLWRRSSRSSRCRAASLWHRGRFRGRRGCCRCTRVRAPDRAGRMAGASGSTWRGRAGDARIRAAGRFGAGREHRRSLGGSRGPASVRGRASFARGGRRKASYVAGAGGHACRRPRGRASRATRTVPCRAFPARRRWLRARRRGTGACAGWGRACGQPVT